MTTIHRGFHLRNQVSVRVAENTLPGLQPAVSPRKYGRSTTALSLDSFRWRYLRLPSRVTLHGRRVGVILTQGMAAPWDRLWRFLATLRPVDMGMA